MLPPRTPQPAKPVLPFLILAGLCAGAYLPALNRPLVSEDYPTLRYLASGSFGELAWQNFTGPEMGIELVRFYRPLTVLAWKCQSLLWGTWPGGYLGVQGLVHLLNLWLLLAVVRGLRPDGLSPLSLLVVGMPFALYPWQANTVLWLSALGTQLSTTGMLATLYLHLRSPEGMPWAALVCFALALGCYEGAAVLPGLLPCLALLSWRPDQPLALAASAKRLVPYAVVLLFYLGLRSAVLGGLTGYGWEPSTAEILRILQHNARFLLIPWDGAVPGVVGWALLLGFALASLISIRYWRTLAARCWLGGLLWICVAQAPFSISRVVPGNGRYWYLATAGLGLLLIALPLAVPARLRARCSLLVFLLASMLYGSQLLRMVDIYQTAGRQALHVRQQIAALPASPGHLFVGGIPRFEYDRQRRPVAHVFNWGLSSALAPPFAAHDLQVYPLGKLRDLQLQPLFAQPGLGDLWRWRDGRLEPLEAANTDAPLASLPLRAGPESTGFQLMADHGLSYQLVVLTRLASYQANLQVDAGICRITLPQALLDTDERFHPSAPAYWWILARDATGRPVACSSLQRLQAPD